MLSHNLRRAALWTGALAAAAFLVIAFAPHRAVVQAAGVQAPTADQQELISRGKQIFDDTPHYAAAYVGNRLKCADCHLESGTAPWSAPLVDLAPLFPMFNKRAGRVISLQERLQECFVRSENGTPPPADSPEMKALVAYIASLSSGTPAGKPFWARGLVAMPPLTGDPKHGERVYQESCALCHGEDGEGIPPALPPLWGPHAYNDGAGIHNPAKMAAFVFHNMPQNQPGTLTPQQAFDVAAFINSMPHPKFNEAYRHY